VISMCLYSEARATKLSTRSRWRLEITTGGKVSGDKGFFFTPTVIEGATQDDEIVRREVFGPVVSVTRFYQDEDAVAWA
ncbi:aldehyde dehydrogenase family protein, partial [Rhizobium ruizarguesonis]